MSLPSLFLLPAAVTLALLLDRLLGESCRFHPLAALGNYISWLEKHCYPAVTPARRFHGVIAVILVLLPLIPLCGAVYFLPNELHWLIAVIGLYFTIGGRSLGEHGRYVLDALQKNDLQEAKQKVSWIVSRKTTNMNRQQVVSATIESMLENGNDALFGALFWFAVAGLPGALLYRVANTLDARWGYKSPKYLHFGWAAARLDDLLNYLPARLCALTYAVQGHFRLALQSWRTQAPLCASPNGGPVMSSGAGALNILIGGPAEYDGYHCDKPLLGTGALATDLDIERAIRLVQRGGWIWAASLTLCAIIRYQFFS